MQRLRPPARRGGDAIAKPLGSLGLLETSLQRIAGLTGSPDIDLSRRAVVVMCADNGVVAQGVTQSGQEITAIVTKNFTTGDTSTSRMAAVAGAQMVPVDIGVACELDVPGLLQRKIRYGTADMTEGPAMTRQEAICAIETGIEIAQELAQKGVRLLATGEMGIGNTTTSSAIISVLLGRPAAEVTGRGAGLSSAGLTRKIDAIERAVALNRPDPNDPIDVLAKVGGLDIAGLVGVFLGGAACRVPVLLDGFISCAAALVACRICPDAADAMLASHVSAEPAGKMMLDALGLEPLITAKMCLGEGSGAVAAMPLLDMALAVYSQMTTFTQTGIDPYQPLT